MMKPQKVSLIFNTVKYLKLAQLFWQIVYRLKGKTCIYAKEIDFRISKAIVFQKVFYQKNKYLKNNLFYFLNLEKKFDVIDWNFMDYGKLWNYNLEYFDYLNQNDISNEEKLKLLHSFFKFSIENKRVLEPYPVSLRAINIIKFFSLNNIKDDTILNSLYQELEFLNKNLEYHILGNHLLENGFALLMGGVFFEKNEWREMAERLLLKELKEQILLDGAHFELSPMYHQIIFYRVLELIDWYSRYNERDEEFLEFLKLKAALMLGWLKNITFNDGSIPLFNDAANGITYTSNELFDYAKSLNVPSKIGKLKESGFRTFSNDNYEIKIDFAQIGASYQPGHAHADALSFLMYYKAKPLFVEAGTSTYQIGEQRSYERSTKAHNTVEVDHKNQSQVWSGFRVGKRAKTIIVTDSEKQLKAYHDGYADQVGKVFREFIYFDNKIEINDSFEKEGVGVFYLHLDSNIFISSVNESTIKLSNDVSIEFSSFLSLEVLDFKCAVEFNIFNESKTIVVTFKDELKTMINL